MDGNFWNKRVVYHVPGMDAVTVQRDMSYGPDDETARMDVYAPADVRPGTRLPGIVFIHGGPVPAHLRPLAKDWGIYTSYGALAAAAGFIGVTFNHRYHGLTDLAQAAGDIQAALGYLRDQAEALHLDADRLALWAFSGGGLHLSATLREQPAYVRCLVAYYARMDLRPRDSEWLRDLPDATIAAFFTIEALRAAGTVVTPLLIARAGQDTNGSLDAFIAEALTRNMTLDVLNHPQGQHGFDYLNDDARSRAIIAHTLDFVQTHLRQAV